MNLAILFNFVECFKEDVSKHHRGERKRIIARPTLEGLIFTTLNLVKLAEIFLEAMPCLWLKSFTQDILEACFGNLVCVNFSVCDII